MKPTASLLNLALLLSATALVTACCQTKSPDLPASFVSPQIPPLQPLARQKPPPKGYTSYSTWWEGQQLILQQKLTKLGPPASAASVPTTKPTTR